MLIDIIIFISPQVNWPWFWGLPSHTDLQDCLLCVLSPLFLRLELDPGTWWSYQEYVFTPLYRIIALSLDLSEWLQKPISSPVLLLVMAGGQNINIKERKIVHVVVERLSFLKIKILGILLGIFGWIWDHLKHLGNWAWKSPQNIVCPTLFPV